MITMGIEGLIILNGAGLVFLIRNLAITIVAITT